MFKEPIHNDINKGIFSDDQIYEQIDKHLPEDANFEEFDKLEKKYRENNRVLFNPTIQTTCVFCRSKNVINIQAKDIISKNDIASLYETFAEISYHTNNGFLDISAMLPFEREVMISLIQKVIDEE